MAAEDWWKEGEYDDILSGTMKITGAAGSTLSITFSGEDMNSPISIFVDENGDGNLDGEILTTLAELQSLD